MHRFQILSFFCNQIKLIFFSPYFYKHFEVSLWARPWLQPLSRRHLRLGGCFLHHSSQTGILRWGERRNDSCKTSCGVRGRAERSAPLWLIPLGSPLMACSSVAHPWWLTPRGSPLVARSSWLAPLWLTLRGSLLRGSLLHGSPYQVMNPGRLGCRPQPPPPCSASPADPWPTPAGPLAPEPGSLLPPAPAWRQLLVLHTGA